MDEDISPSINSDKPDQTSSNVNNDDSDKCITSREYDSLMDKLQTKTAEFLAAISATKSVTTKNVLHQAGNIHVKPLSTAAYDKIDDFIDSIDMILEWHETRGKQYQAAINSLVKGIALTSDEADKKIKELEQTIAEQQNTITELKQSLAAAENGCKQTTANVYDAYMNEENESLEAQLKYEVENKTLKNKIIALKKENSDLRQKATISPSVIQRYNFVELQDIINPWPLIDYKHLEGKVLSLDKVHHFNEQFCIAFYHDGVKECSIKIAFNDSFRIRLNGEVGLTHRTCVDGLVHCGKYIYSSELKYLHIADCSIIFNLLVLLIRSRTIEKLDLSRVIIENGNTYVLLENVLGYMPNLKELKCTFPAKCNYLQLIASNFLQLPTFKNLQLFELHGCPYDFDLESFGKFMKKHYFAKFILTISVSNSPKEIFNKLFADSKALLSSWQTSSPKPSLQFDTAS